jgi:hypothetical protein
VTTEGQHQTVLVVREHSEDRLLLDEITRPKRGAQPTSWRGWIEANAPGSSTWLCHVIDLKSGQVTACYSFGQGEWLPTNGQNWFLSTLFSLNLAPLPPFSRRRLGPMTASSQEESRNLWHPKLIVEGASIPGAHFSAWQCRWPADGSQLSDQWIVLYFPECKGAFPHYLPYWIELNDPAHAAKLRTIDSGKGARCTRLLPPCPQL